MPNPEETPGPQSQTAVRRLACLAVKLTGAS
jgi:hypothetical protein